jgi:hypothetical protein
MNYTLFYQFRDEQRVYWLSHGKIIKRLEEREREKAERRNDVRKIIVRVTCSDGKVRFGNRFEPEPNANRTPGSADA